MAEISKAVSLNVDEKNRLPSIIAKQGDNSSRFIRVTIMNGGSKVSVSPSSTVTLNAEKPDNTHTVTPGTVNDDGTVTVELSHQTLALDGTVKCDISVASGEAELTTTLFYVEVERRAVGDDDIISSDDYGAIQELITTVNTLDSTITKNEEVRGSNENLRKAAEVKREQAEAQRIENDEAVKVLIDSFVDDMPIANTTTPGGVKSGADIVVFPGGAVYVPALTSKADKTALEPLATKEEMESAIASLFQFGEAYTETFSDSGTAAVYALRYYKTVQFSKVFDHVPRIFLSERVLSPGSGSISFTANDVTKTGFTIRSDYATSEIYISWLAI